MKSKKIKLAVIALILLLTGGWAWWQLKPKSKDTFTNKEISIKQTEIPDVATVTYRDWAGFQFDYPNILTVKEIELDNADIYSSLEISGSDNKTMTIRISDTQITDLSDWQKTFSLKNSVRTIDQTALADIPALNLVYGAPEMNLTVAIDNGIIYEIESLADDGFWDRTHNDLIDSWQFTNTAPDNGQVSTAPVSGGGETVVLIEEILE